VISRLAVECGAIDPAQGIPDFLAEPEMFAAMDRHMRAGRKPAEAFAANMNKVPCHPGAARCRGR
jgi:hypothetical protein